MTPATIDIVAPDEATPAGDNTARLLGAAAWSAALSACGGGSGDATVVASDTERAQALAAGAPTVAASAPLTQAPTREQAARLLAQASFSSTASEILEVQQLGLSGWLERELKRPRGDGYVQMISPGQPDFDAGPLADGRVGLNRALWRKFITSPDVLRQRVTLALSEIIVISMSGVIAPQRGFAAAAFMDILEQQAFGNYGDLLMGVSTTAAMGAYLTYLNSRKANGRGSQPDENYARELMQLFSIGLHELKPNGKPVLARGERIETYTQDDVMGLARVFTGWTFNNVRPTPYDIVTRPMRQDPAFHETGEKVFLGTTIPANTSGEASLKIAIDVLMAHPNVGPFIGRQLIQRLVTSNPSPEYVQRVAAAFDGDDQRRKGDMKATLRAIFLDDEATSADKLHDSHHGKLREPMVRFIQWARTFGLKPGAFPYFRLGDLSDPAQMLGQSPLHSPTVFNFFRPGYVPPNSALGLARISAPEFQITTESSVAGYINFMEQAITRGVGGGHADYESWLPLAQDPSALLAELNVVMAAGQVSQPTLKRLAAAVGTIDIGVVGGRLRRVQAALTLLMAAPEYLVLK